MLHSAPVCVFWLILLAARATIAGSSTYCFSGSSFEVAQQAVFEENCG